jgi:hypothetical protein
LLPLTDVSKPTHICNVLGFAIPIVFDGLSLPVLRPLHAVVLTTGLVKALVILGRSTDIAGLLGLKSLYVVVFSVHFDVCGTSLDVTLFWDVANDAVAEFADLRTNVFTRFKGTYTDDCIAD